MPVPFSDLSFACASIFYPVDKAYCAMTTTITTTNPSAPFHQRTAVAHKPLSVEPCDRSQIDKCTGQA
jgi:hypothetical protein